MLLGANIDCPGGRTRHTRQLGELLELDNWRRQATNEIRAYRPPSKEDVDRPPIRNEEDTRQVRRALLSLVEGMGGLLQHVLL